MNLLFRLFITLMFGLRRGAVDVLAPCETPFRVWPNDLDILRHMNNGRYFSVLDVARVDLMNRSGLWPKLMGQGWYPVVVNETMRFRRSLSLWDRYIVRTTVIGWDAKHVLLEQSFVRDGIEVATAIVKARFLKRSGGTVTTQELLDLANISRTAPALPAWVMQWSEAVG